MIVLANKSTLKFILCLAFFTDSFSNYSQNQTSVKFGEFIVTPIKIATINTKLKNEIISEPVNIFLIQTKDKNILIDAGNRFVME